MKTIRTKKSSKTGIAMKKSISFILFLFFIFCSTQSLGNMYSWKDKNGGMHFSNNPPPVGDKPIDLEVSQEIEYDALKDNQRTERLRTRIKPKAAVSKTPKKKKKKIVSHGDVVVFSTVRCGYCVRAKAFLDKHKVKYSNIDINKSSEGRKRYNKLNGRGVPLILVGDKQIRGFNKTALIKALGL